MSLKSKNKEAVEYQGVINADVFFDHFVPISLESPPALFPIANVPLIDYSIEFLTSLNVCEIFVLCSNAHISSISSHIKSRYHSAERQSFRSRNIPIKTINTGDSRTEADALRELDRDGSIKDDFILLRGCGIFNLNIQPALREFEEAKAKKKGYLMTMCFRQITMACGDDYWLVLHNEDTPCVVLSPKNDVVEINMTTKSQDVVKIPHRVLESVKNFSLYYNLIDTSVDICSRRMLLLLAENFDWRDIRSQFVKGVNDSEVIDQPIHAHVFTSGYVGVPHTLKRYLEVARQFIGRWAFPLTVDSNLFQESYSFNSRNTYKSHGAVISPTASLTSDVVIGTSTEVSDKAVVSQSCIGNYCKIGKNSKLVNSVLWEGVTVGDNVTIENSLIGNAATLKNGCSVQGALISNGVIIGTGFALPEGKRVKCGKLLNKFGVLKSPKQDVLNSPKIGESYDKDVGEDGVGTIIISDYEDIMEDDFALEVEAGQEAEENKLIAMISEEDDFYEEIRSTVFADLNINADADNLAIEIQSLKLTMNRTPFETEKYVVYAILDYASEISEDAETDVIHTLRTVLDKYSQVPRGYSTDETMLTLLISLEEYFEHSEDYSNKFMSVLHLLYEEDILDEDAILKWAENEKGSERTQLYVARCEKLIQWLKTAEEEE